MDIKNIKQEAKEDKCELVFRTIFLNLIIFMMEERTKVFISSF